MIHFPNQEKADENVVKKENTPRRRGYAGRSADQLIVERRQRLLAAALELFGTQGYASTSIDKLCAEAKVTTRHFYEQFADKEKLLIAVFEQVMKDTQAQVLAVMLDQQLPEEGRFFAALDAFMTAQLSDPRRARLTTTEVLGVSNATEVIRNTVMNQFTQLIEIYMNRLASTGQIPARNYRILAIGLVGAMHELQIAWLNPANHLTRELLEKEVQFLGQAFLNGANVITD